MLRRLWAALTCPGAGDILVSAAQGYEFVDWGGADHVGGGSHGSLRRGDSLGPLAFVNCGPDLDGGAAVGRPWWIGDVYQRFGPRVVITMGSLAMALGVATLGVVMQPWHLYPVFLVMAVGWGAMSGAALNLLVAPYILVCLTLLYYDQRVRREGGAQPRRGPGGQLANGLSTRRGTRRSRGGRQNHSVQVEPTSRRPITSSAET